MKRDRREYHRKLRSTAGYAERQRLKERARMVDPEYAAKERERERLRSERRRMKAREQINEAARLRHASRIKSDPTYRQKKAAAALRWIKGNPGKAAANVMRRDAQKLRATPAWADSEQIQAIYEVAAACRSAGFQWEVDHIVPLRSDRVCGLHVPVNLQLLDATANKSKGNRSWPNA